jgi:tetratricopeptide (TPR) repeat protein
MGKYKEAIKLYNKILKSEPDNLEALVGKAKGLYRIYNYKQGKELFQRALNLKKLSREQKKSIRDSYIDSSLTLGQNYLKDKDYDKAILLFCDVRDKDPKTSKPRNLWLYVIWKKGKSYTNRNKIISQQKKYFYAVIDLKPGGNEEKAAKDYINRIASAYAPSAPPSVQPVYETYYQNVSTPSYTEINDRE